MADRWLAFASAKCSGSSKNRPANAKISILIFLSFCLKRFRLSVRQQCLWIFQLAGKWRYIIPLEAGRGIGRHHTSNHQGHAPVSQLQDHHRVAIVGRFGSWPRRIPRGCWTASRQIVVWKGQINRQMQRMDSKKGMRSRVTFEDRKP